MRAMPISAATSHSGWLHAKISFRKNWLHYLQEAFGLAIFMMSACIFGALLEAKNSLLHQAIPAAGTRLVIMGILMGLTALFIFYSPFTSPSGSHINPAVTLAFLRMRKICVWDAAFYIVFQFAGGTAAVYAMQMIIGNPLTNAPVNSVVTVPGAAGIPAAAITEFIIAFLTMSMVLYTSAHERLKNYTRIIAGAMVCIYVIVAGPVSGFGMNPARSFASALPAHIWTASWIYLIIPVVAMLCAAECFSWYYKKIIEPGETISIISLQTSKK